MPRLIQSLRIDPTTGWLYVASVDILEQRVIYAYNEKHELEVAFCDTWAKGKDVDVRLEKATAGGRIDIDEGGTRILVVDSSDLCKEGPAH